MSTQINCQNTKTWFTCKITIRIKVNRSRRSASFRICRQNLVCNNKTFRNKCRVPIQRTSSIISTQVIFPSRISKAFKLLKVWVILSLLSMLLTLVHLYRPQIPRPHFSNNSHKVVRLITVSNIIIRIKDLPVVGVKRIDFKIIVLTLICTIKAASPS